MASKLSKQHLLIKYGLGVIFFFVCVFIGYYIIKGEDRLPIYNPNEVNRELVDPSLWEVTSGHTVSDFKLTNQLGQDITQQDLDGKIYVTDFFFTTCGTICPRMTKQLKRVQDAFPNEEDLMILSHSVTPDIDTVEVLARYAEKHGVDSKRWWLTTGDQEHIFELARKSYFAVIKGESGAEKGFVHTENFVLIDKEKRIRGYYSGVTPSDVDRLIKEIDLLLAEYEE